ncbi:MAG: hypothetical protein CR974_01115 [Gammaproteobacteria bacterium]|nr:MAG: hypothetical protein CR974_01115 [Gammaproteobacteria bacterium]
MSNLKSTPDHPIFKRSLLSALVATLGTYTTVSYALPGETRIDCKKTPEKCLNLSTPTDVGLYNDLNTANSATQNFGNTMPVAQPRTNRSTTQTLLDDVNSGMLPSTNETQQIATAADKAKAKADAEQTNGNGKGTPTNPTALNELKQLKAQNTRLANAYQAAKLDQAKAHWDDLYKRQYTDADVNERKTQLDNNVAEMQALRSQLSLSGADATATTPVTADDTSITTAINTDIEAFKASNTQTVNNKIAELEHQVEVTKSSVNNFTLEYNNLVRKIKKNSQVLNAHNFKPTERNKDQVAHGKKQLNQWKADAEKARTQANIYLRKLNQDQKALEYAKIEKFHYDGKKDTYGNAKSGLDQAYVGVVPKQLDKTPLQEAYDELMAILNQPIQPPQKVGGEYRGFFSTIGDDKNSAEFDYTELEEDGDLTDKSKRNATLITHFGGSDEGMKNEDLMTGDKDHFGDYQHVAMGEWSSPGNEFSYTSDKGNKKVHPADKGYWILGKPTKTLPKKGSANYAGEVAGHAVNDQGVRAVDGNIHLKAHFDDKTMSGNMSVDYSDNGESFADLKLKNGKIDLSQEENVPEQLKGKDFTTFFEADLATTDGQKNYHSDIVGAFYGDDASEMGGTWELDVDKGNASGVFRAKTVKPQPTGEFRGMFSTIGEEKRSAEFDYVELEKNGDLKDSTKRDAKLVTRFGEHGLEDDTVTTGNKDHYGSYEYVAMGKWSSPDNEYTYHSDHKGKQTVSADEGYWVLGKPTKALPKMGQASFKGEVLGHAVNDSGDIDNLEGEIGLKADFETKRIAGTMDVDYASGGDFTTVEFSHGNIGVSKDNEEDELPDALADKDFSTFFSADWRRQGDSEYHGDIVGTFYGDDASEVGGAWALYPNVSQTSGSASGIFRAKQTNKKDNLIPDDPNKIIYNWGGAIAVTASGSNAPINTGSSSNVGDAPIANGKANIYNRYENKSENVALSYGDYQYAAWGNWETDYGNNSHGFKQVVYGQLTPELPRTGSADYKGELHGSLYKNNSVDSNSITGDVNLTANFADRKLSGSLEIKHNGNNWATAQVHPDRLSHSGEYRTDVSLDKGTGRLRGFFFGKDAAETGGAFNIDKETPNGHEWINGTYRAKKQ